MSGVGWSFFRRAYLVYIFETSIEISREIAMQPIDFYSLYLSPHPPYLR